MITMNWDILKFWEPGIPNSLLLVSLLTISYLITYRIFLKAKRKRENLENLKEPEKIINMTTKDWMKLFFFGINPKAKEDL